MAKKKKSEAEKLDNFNNGLESILNQYEILPKKERKDMVLKLRKDIKKESKHWAKTNDGSAEFRIKSLQHQIETLEGQNDRIPIQYGVFKFHIKHSYLKSIKNKEQYLDGLFHKKMQKVFSDTKKVFSEGQANELQALITIYDKKIKNSKFYNENSVDNAIEKLTKFRNEKLSDWDYSDYIKEKLGMEVKESSAPEIYKAVKSPLLLEGKLVGINFNFF